MHGTLYSGGHVGNRIVACSRPFPHTPAVTMSKRQYSSIDDDAPGEDDARYGRISSSTATSYTYPVTDEIAEELYREVHGRVLNTLQPLYQLPCDEEEIKVGDQRSVRSYLILFTAAGLLSQTDVYGSGRQELCWARVRYSRLSYTAEETSAGCRDGRRVMVRFVSER